MFKKFLSLALVLMMVMGVAAVAASAAQVEVPEVGAEATVAEQGADAEVASTGVDTANCVNYDNSGTGWEGPVLFYFYEIGGDEVKPWGSSKLEGTDEDGDGIWSFDPSSLGLDSSKQYGLIFNDKKSGAQTYDLLFDTSCIGDTGYVTGNQIENPKDSNKTGTEAKWRNSSLGPVLVVTSIGNVVGETCPSNTSPYQLLVDFLKNTLTNALTFSGKDEQTQIDDTAKALNLTQADVTKAISEAGISSSWSASKSSLPAGEGGSDSSSSASSTGSSASGTSSTASKASSTSTASSKSGSASNTQTGQTETMLFIMLGVMVAAAGVIFFARKRERA